MESNIVKLLDKPTCIAVKQKYLINELGMIEGCFQQRRKFQQRQDNESLLRRNLKLGFNPTWYIVSHFNDGGNNKKLQKRRLDNYQVEEDLLAVKLKLFQLLYGRSWEKMKTRARSMWTIEYGTSTLKPHFNLLLEDVPLISNNYKSIDNIFNKILPKKVRCLWADSSKVQRIYNDPLLCLSSYITKESNFLNQTIVPKVNDYIKPNNKTY